MVKPNIDDEPGVDVDFEFTPMLMHVHIPGRGE
jgi:hypothetical protein